MNTDRARLASAISHRRHFDQILRGTACAAALTAALTVMSLPAAAAHDVPKDQHKPKHKETAHVSKDPFENMPKGPLQIIISINQQKLHLYGSGTHVADALIASGMPGHPTPMGVFSVIEKERYHHSNIYSGAPMPYMQRITWSGVAMHEGVGLGHPASHGCIRMPHEFAARFFLLRSLGARVVIARPELKLTEIADPHLFVHKTVAPPAPNAAAPMNDAIKTAQTIDSGTTTDAVPAAVPAESVDRARTFVAPTGATAPVAAAAKDSNASTAENTAGANDDPPRAATEPHDETRADPAVAAAADDAGTKAAKPPADQSAAANPGDRPGDPPATAALAQPTDAAAANRPAMIDTAVASPLDAAAKVSNETAPPAAAADPKPDLKTDSKPGPEPVRAAAPAGDTSKPAMPAADAAVSAPADAAPGTVPIPTPKPAAIAKPLKHDPIAIFVSRKTKKIYVRQNFAPLFDAAVTIARPDEPLGTHVFTALDYLADGATFRWNVVSLPGEEPKAARDVEKKSEKDAKGKRHESVAKPNPEPLPLQTPQQALARIEIPQDVIEQISELMIPGSSLLVSDQGLGEETGEGTDFILVTR